MRFAAAALALSGAVMADYGYPVSSKAPVYPVSSKEPVYPASSKNPVYPAYPVSSKAPVYTTSTVYATSTYTAKAGESNVVYSSVYPVSTTICTAEESKPTYPVYPVYNTSSTYEAKPTYPVYPVGGSKPVYPTSGASPVYPVYPTGGYSASTQAPACPTYSVETISTSYTTVIPTVVYKTVSVPCPEQTYPSKPTYPVGTGYPVANTTSTPYVTAGAANLGFSGVLAAAAGLAAVFLA